MFAFAGMAFERLSVGAVATLVAAAALLAVYTVVVLREISKWLADVRSSLRTRDESDMDKAVIQRMRETRLSNVSSVIEPLTHVFPLLCLGTALDVLSTGRLQDLPVVAVQLVVAALIFLLHLCPKLISPKTLFWWQGVFFLLSSALVVPGVCSPDRLSLVTRLSGLLITASNCVLLHIPTAVAQHGLYLLVTFISMSLSTFHAEDMSKHFGTEVVAAMLSCMCVAVMQRLVEAQLRSNLQLEYLAEKQLATNKLLSVFNEIVVEVDPDLAQTAFGTFSSDDPDPAELSDEPQLASAPLKPVSAALSGEPLKLAAEPLNPASA